MIRPSLRPLVRSVVFLATGLLLATSLSIATSPGLLTAQQRDSTSLLTRAERTDFRETTRYDEVMRISRTVAELSSDIQLTTYGYTFEGRPLPLLVVGDVDAASPEAVRGSGKTRVYLQGGIHAGEIAGKEALLILLRELAQGDHSHWSDSLVLLIAPLYNADGNERVNLLNRRRQNGPVGGMGQRSNAMGLDLNRDQMKLDAPESRALVGLYTAYDPHLSVDLHTTNGTRHAYHLTYAPPLNPNTPQEIDGFLRGEWLPAVTQGVKENHGFDLYYFGDVRRPRGSDEGGWYTFDPRGRYVSNYIGLRNRFGILGEAFAYATFRDRTMASKGFTEEILEFAHGHAGEIRARALAADARSVVGDRLALRATFQRSEEPVTILMGEVEEERNPYSGQTMLRRTDAQIPTEMYEYGTFSPTETETVPAVYLIPSSQRVILERLVAHGIQTSTLQQGLTLEVEEFVVDSMVTSAREYEGHFGQEVFGAYSQETRAYEAGTVVLSLDQPLGKVAFSLLEPRSDDGFVAWGFFGDDLNAGETYPIARAFPESVAALTLPRAPEGR